MKQSNNKENSQENKIISSHYKVAVPIWYRVDILLLSARIAMTLSYYISSSYSYSINQIYLTLVCVGVVFSFLISFVRVVLFFSDEFELVFAALCYGSVEAGLIAYMALPCVNSYFEN